MKFSEQTGQSTIEFILTFTFGIGLIFIVFSSALNYVVGYLTHYATFTAARAYMVYDNSLNTPDSELNGAEQVGRENFNRFQLERFEVAANNLKFNSYLNASNNNYVGAYVVYKKRLDILGRVLGGAEATMISEAYLGKEVSRANCAYRTCYGLTGQTTPGNSCGTNFDITLFDNGC